ncbi:bifunctional UDP-N-acetylglucosamine diphosphorylase/glucosamine-1-phosphate N-acetyltransferase GlmU [Eubacteriales bacterium OttesenSCG-928-M02]|nr:bifunctional UDP-N-acetylglucosamine diphosphorylase/glucosamine-1-phosphate N-acetyltransferase GlmU [Eubacteriales bacterium OttesenSCG-928-M02]
MQENYGMIMAAGHGKRMKSRLPKVLHPVCGKPMIERLIQVAQAASGKRPIVIVGVGKEQVMEAIGDRADFAVQEEQKGTGHAVMMAREYLVGKKGYVAILAGDMPLLKAETVEEMFSRCREESLDALVLTSMQEDPTGYGRVIRDSVGNVLHIVEEKDATDEERQVQEVNASVYCFDIEKLLPALDNLKNDNAQGEYYLPDVIGMLSPQGKVGALVVDAEECLGVNDRVQLAQAETTLRRRINEGYMMGGVSMIDPAHTYIEDGVVIGQDTVVYPGVHIRGNSAIGEGCTLDEGCVIVDSAVGDGCHIRSSTLMEAKLGKDVTVGPYAYLRPGADVGDGAHIGDFVEIKNATIGKGTKLPHLTYVGDAAVGEYCNIACGVVFANYDGLKKYQATVGNGVFLGCNVNLVAPVHVADGAYVAAGTTVAGEDVPPGALSVGRAKQYIKEGWADEKRAKGELRDVY